MFNLFGKIFYLTTISCIVVVVSGCGGQPAEDIAPLDSDAQTVPETPAPVSTLPNEIADPVSPISPISPLLPGMASMEPIEGSETALSAAVVNLSERTGIPAEQIKLVSMEAVEWGDASLGCPQEGFMYAQVITPGYLISLEADVQLYEYHTDQDGNVILCQEEE
jgi:hypothetical protein